MTPTDAAVPPDRTDVTERGDRAEYGVALLLGVLGAWSIYQAANTEDRAARGFATSSTLPWLVGILLVVLAVALVFDLRRGGHGEQESGEDVDLSHGADWKTVGLLVLGFAFNAAFIEQLGWPITGAVMFFLSTIALGGRHYIRTAIIAVILSIGSWYLFYALDIQLPLGLLDGVL